VQPNCNLRLGPRASVYREPSEARAPSQEDVGASPTRPSFAAARLDVAYQWNFSRNFAAKPWNLSILRIITGRLPGGFSLR
jgi:hypothetical protein